MFTNLPRSFLSMGHVGPETVSTFLSILSMYIYNLRVVIRISVAQVSVRGSSWLWGVIIGCFPWTKVKCQILKLQIKWSCHQSADVSICLSVFRKLGEPNKAENFLLDAMTSYHQEGWKKLRDMARLELAQCQYQVADQNKYSYLFLHNF